MVDKQNVTLTELINKIDEVKKRYEQKVTTLRRRRGRAIPSVSRAKAARPKFKVGDRVRIKDLPDIFYTRCQVYTRGAVGTVAVVTHESPAPEDEAWDNTDKSRMVLHRALQAEGPLAATIPAAFANDSLQTEFSERWLEPA